MVRELRLSPRLRDVLDGACRGETTTATARRLHVSPNTVKNHRRVLLEVLGARTIAEAVHNAHRWGLLDETEPAAAHGERAP